jgi:hypothetical protein
VDKGIERVYAEEKIFCTGPTKAAKAEQNLFYWLDKPNEPLLAFVLFESPFTSISTVCRGHFSLL